MRPLRHLLIVLIPALLVASPCWAQTMTVSSITASSPNLGNVVSAATGDTVFTVTASSGAITIASGGGKRISTGTSITSVTVACSGGGNACNNTNANLTVSNAGTPTLRARALTNFTVAMGTATLIGSTTGTNPLTFTIGPIGKSSSKTFLVGLDFPIADDASGLATGNAASSFSVSIVPSTGGTTNTLTGSAIADVFRPLSLSFLPAGGLAFGRLVRPSTGSGTVDISAVDGTRTVSGTNAIALPTPASNRVVYTATGEGGQAISITVPATFAMTSGSNSLTVTTTATASGAQTLSNAIGSAGTFAFGVGGSFPFTSTTVGGNYTGTFMVTVAYN